MAMAGNNAGSSLLPFRGPPAADVLVAHHHGLVVEIGDDLELEAGEIGLLLINARFHQLEAGLDAARRGQRGLPSADRERVLARELRIEGDAVGGVALLA